MKRVRIMVGAICLCVACSLCSCGERKSDTIEVDVDEGFNGKAVQTTEVETTEPETATKIEIEAREDKLVPKTTEPNIKPTVPPDYIPFPIDEFTSEDAERYIYTSMQALLNEDWETVMTYTNFGSICRIGEKSLTDEMIVEEIKSGKYDEQLAEYRDAVNGYSRLPADSIIPQVSTPEKMEQADLNEISELINKMSAGQAEISFTDGYKASVEGTSGLANMYVLCYEDEGWKFDLCFGLMRDGLKYLTTNTNENTTFSLYDEVVN